MEFEKVNANALSAMAVGAVVCILAPVVIALCWKIKKKERFTTILIGAATFVLFVAAEKIIQNMLIFPVQMGLPDHAASRFISERPILWALLVGAFPGVFEETGRLVAFRTVLRKRKNRETSISYGIGHGGAEVMLILGTTFVQNIVYAVMINRGTFQTLIDQIAQQAPEQVQQGYALASQLAAFSYADLGLGIVERISAVLFHIGASILVFYACRDTQKRGLYPLAILLHTCLDFFAALTMTGTLSLSAPVQEGVFGCVGLVTFLLAYFLLYRKDTADFSAAAFDK